MKALSNLLALLCLVLTACSPDYGDGGFTCKNGMCPPGYVCISRQYCRRQGAPPLDAFVPSNPCAGKPDGTDCSTADQKGLICRADKCVPTTCGDGFIDTRAGEECDDRNQDPNDGCNACKFTCKDSAQCDDKSTCNGEETCDLGSHTCKPGVPLPDGTACDLAEGQKGSCSAGTCAPPGCGDGMTTPPEECDDGNKVDGDGCNNDCRFSCHLDDDCDDKDGCNGVETCKKEPDKQYCVPGMPVKVTCWEDKDSDGYAAAGAAKLVDCKCPAGYTAKDPGLPGNADCHDGLADVNPGQTAWFTSTYCSYCKSYPCICTASRDWNCSGAVEQQYPAKAGSCGKGLIGCTGSGWVGGAVPECGASGTYQSCVLDKLLGICTASTSTRTQGCH